MIFIVRGDAGSVPPAQVKMVRRTPASVAMRTGQVDYFCLGDPAAARDAGLSVVPVHDGWYADDTTGGMAIWGQGQFWEVRDTPFQVKEACGPEAWPTEQVREAADVNVRQAIFSG
jgi:hypothetical protein